MSAFLQTDSSAPNATVLPNGYSAARLQPLLYAWRRGVLLLSGQKSQHEIVLNRLLDPCVHAVGFIDALEPDGKLEPIRGVEPFFNADQKRAAARIGELCDVPARLLLRRSLSLLIIPFCFWNPSRSLP